MKDNAVAFAVSFTLRFQEDTLHSIAEMRRSFGMHMTSPLEVILQFQVNAFASFLKPFIGVGHIGPKIQYPLIRENAYAARVFQDE